MMRESLAALARSNATAATGNPRSRGRADHAVQVAGTALLADPDGALYWADEKLLVVADLHLEKGSAFARRGVLVKDPGVIHLRKVVIFCRQPKNRNGRDAIGGEMLCQFNRG